MKIVRTDLALHADQTLLKQRQSSESLRAWHGEAPGAPRPDSSSLAQISAAAREALAQPAAPAKPASPEAEAVQAAQDAIDNDPFLSLVRQMIERLTGEKLRVFDMQSFSAEMRHIEINASETREALRTGGAGQGLAYDYHAIQEEYEATRFSAEGVVKTADGQEISFRLDLEMSRYYREESQVSLRSGDAVKRQDPLVVNFGGTAAQLAQQAGHFFRFDLDGDGEDELIPLFASGSGYLAFDLNRNGLIDSGKELFGPASGNGFNELARLDEDGNGWIDEGDRAFDRLSVWTPTAAGGGTPRQLADVGIGALGLAHVASPFGLRGDDNRDLGQVKSGGVYLSEAGTAGSLQEIDLTV